MELLDKNGLTEAEYLASYRAGDYERPSVAADVAVFRETPAGCELLLIRRGGHPFLGKWALPGGFSEPGETVDGAAVRELREETGLSDLPLTPVGFFSLPGRDKRAWTMSEGFATLLPEDGQEPQAGDDARETAWFAVNSRWAQGVLTLSFTGPERFEAKLIRDGSYAFSILDTGGLAFDHAHIIARAMHKSLPPLSSTGSAPPPTSSATCRASPVKLSTSAVRERLSPQMLQSSRSASWLYCSGTSRIRPRRRASTARRSSS